MKNRINLILSFTFIIFGLFGIYMGASSLVNGLASLNWSKTDGVITSAKVERDLGAGNITVDTFEAKVSYDYKVARVNYTGTRICFGNYSGNSGRAQIMVRRYKPGTKVSVYYSPEHPENAVLEPGVGYGAWLALGVGSVLLMAWLWMFKKKIIRI